MSLSRRQFLAAAAVGGSMGIGSRPPVIAARPLDILILGGTGFTGPEQVEYAIARGHLQGNVGHYVFVSTISVYRDNGSRLPTGNATSSRRASAPGSQPAGNSRSSPPGRRSSARHRDPLAKTGWDS